MMELNAQNIELLFNITRGIISLFQRHQQGENVSADLNELLEKVQVLKTKEEARAAGVMPEKK